jgi:light-regulated signal transduction histidine kinase (bacteriophytochrome)
MLEQTLDLAQLDQEPIHIPGQIQPHGVLLALDATTLNILQVSNNTQEWLGRSPEQLLGQPLSTLLDAQQLTAVQQCLGEAVDSIHPLPLRLRRGRKVLRFDGMVHPSDDGVLLELEPEFTADHSTFFDFYQQVRGAITRIQKASTLGEMSRVVAREVRHITGFDRVMVYQFAADGSGHVIAEATDHDTSFLNLHYPATDIPALARQMFSRNWLRLIPNTTYQPIALTPPLHPHTHQPLDLSLAVLRHVSPCHIEYLRNMGAAASMTISLIQDQQLWGLIACHHFSPRHVPYSVRTACEFIGQVMSVELANKIANEDLDYKMELKSLQTSFVETLSQSEHLIDGLMHLDTKLLDLVSAEGAVVWMGDRCEMIGQTPPPAALPALLNWLKPNLHHNLFQTESLSSLYPEAQPYQAIASGLLALEISKVHQSYILWFRPEVLQTVNWSGDPRQPVTVHASGGPEQGTLRLSPRQSFALWQQTVSGCALPWKPCELEIVAELRGLLVGIVLRQADELASMNLELQRSNEELDSFAYIASHDLKEPLRGIHNYANFLMEDYTEVLDAAGVEKLQTLVRLTQRMEDLINSLLHFSRLGRLELNRQAVNLDDLVHQVMTTLTIARPQHAIAFRMPRPLPVVKCDRAQVNELFTNLISNAIKYNNKPDRWVEISYLEESQSASQPLIFYVRDNGIGIAKEYLHQIFQIFRRLHGRDEYEGGTGVGLTIARKIVERHGGKLWLESVPDEGSTFYFTLAAETFDELLPEEVNA